MKFNIKYDKFLEFFETILNTFRKFVENYVNVLKIQEKLNNLK